MNAFQKFLKHYFQVGSILPSSKYLWQKIISNIDFSKDITLVEFWAGNGVFSDIYLPSITPKSHIYLFEIQDDLIEILQKKYSHLTNVSIIQESAENIGKYVSKWSVDYIISWLPLAYIKDNTVDNILKISKDTLKPQWVFLQFQYFLQNKSQISHTFPHIKYKFTPLNFPPAFIYICTK